MRKFTSKQDMWVHKRDEIQSTTKMSQIVELQFSSKDLADDAGQFMVST